MKKKGLSSLLITVGGGIVVFVLIAAFLSSLRSTTEVIVAKQSLPAGARLTAEYLELREVHTSDVMDNALTAIEDAENQVLTIARAPGDQITADMIGNQASVGLANQLLPGHRAVAVHVDQASGLLGVLRPGDHVAIVAIVDPQAAQVQQQMSYAATPALFTDIEDQQEDQEQEQEELLEPPAPAAYVVVSNLRVLLVPQLFRYEETLPTEEDEGGFAPARTSLSNQRDSVILLDVPTEPVEVVAGADKMSPAALLPLLDAHAKLHLLLEPASADNVEVTVGADLGDLYRAMIGWTKSVTITTDVGAPIFIVPATESITATDITTDTMGGGN